jgi:hypothetical protein
MKNQIVSGIRGLSRGLVFVALAASLVLGACEVIDQPDVEDLGSYTVPDAQGKVRVVVKTGDDARSLTSDQAKGLANYYEIIFRDNEAIQPVDTLYYRDSQPKGETLSVQVPVNHYFDILLLSGSQSKRVLLGSSFVNDKAPDGAARYDVAGKGYFIEAGKVNIIDMTIIPITINPVDDFTITYGPVASPTDITLERNTDAAATGGGGGGVNKGG